MSTLYTFSGRLHPLLVHLPIGILLLAFCFALWEKWKGNTGLKPALKPALGLGALSALLAVMSGYVLADGGDYAPELLERHRWLGMATALASILAWYACGRNLGFYAQLAVVLLLLYTGHLGGSLTHGEGYLWAAPAKTGEATKAKAISPQTPVYAGIIAPILAQKCVSCHNPNKRKGDLELGSPEKINAGGKNGPVLKTGDPENSELLRRVLLPLSDEGHMPPKGKIPLSNDEIQLLRWWIAAGADFQKTVAELPVVPEIEKILNPSERKSPVFDLKIPAASASALAAARAAGISITSLGEESPLLSVSLAGNKKWTPDQFAYLAALAPQVAYLDAAYSNMNDQLWRAIGPLPQLLRLNLSYSAVTTAGLDKLAQSAYLESLNLTGAPVDDALLPKLAPLKYLKTLYTWQSKISAGALDALTAQRPELQLQRGPQAAGQGDTLQLRAPRLHYTRTIFDDTIQVSVVFPHKGITLHYSMDEATPTTQSPAYTGEPIVLHESGSFRAIAARTGWKNSEPASASFARRKYKPEKATLSQSPSPKYPGSGGASLIDGVMGETYTDKAYIGYEGEHLNAVLDFGNPVELRRINLHCIENNNAWIFLPKGVQISTSQDGQKFQPGPSRQYPINRSMQVEKTQILSLPFAAPVTARYVKIRVESPLKNPPWHPGAGQKCWIFVDEVLAE